MIAEAEHVDVAIIGAGPVGMALAIALANSPLKVLLIDHRPPGAWRDDPRALAISHGSQQLLERLGAWNTAAGTAIREIHVSQRGGFGRSIIHAEDYGIAALGYVMRYRDLATALATALEAGIKPAQRLAPCTIDAIETDANGVTLTATDLHGTRQIIAKLLVHAEGTPGNDPDVKVQDYQQHAIVTEIRPSAGHNCRAWERFTPDGPLALLPLGEKYSVVYSVAPDKAAHLRSLGDAEFLAELQQQFGNRLNFVSTGPRASFPLALRVRQHTTRPCQVWIGNSAQALHPVSGQGFNLGLRDAWELAETLYTYSDAGDPAVLTTFARRRNSDRQFTTVFTDSIVHLFSNDLPPLRWARGLGLLALDLFPPLRHLVAKRMIWGTRS